VKRNTVSQTPEHFNPILLGLLTWLRLQIGADSLRFRMSLRWGSMILALSEFPMTVSEFVDWREETVGGETRSW